MNMLIMSNFLQEFYLMRPKWWSDDSVDSWVKGQFYHIEMSKNSIFSPGKEWVVSLNTTKISLLITADCVATVKNMEPTSYWSHSSPSWLKLSRRGPLCLAHSEWPITSWIQLVLLERSNSAAYWSVVCAASASPPPNCSDSPPPSRLIYGPCDFIKSLIPLVI